MVCRLSDEAEGQANTSAQTEINCFFLSSTNGTGDRFLIPITIAAIHTQI